MAKKIDVWILALILSGVLTLALCLTTVWLNIEQVNMGYALKELQVSVNKKKAHTARLQLERDNLLSPYRLKKEAARLGMQAAQVGQIRRMAETPVKE
ncbi:hypothetical protein [Halodesulfovibrio sp.]|jgi:cell division protein FtsL|uniref:hypothetical protein n=1 Tax=Halodesulfovibrio sp. TaxID=1912772 RepID=UPI0025EE883E|nr:hypothetical protein [Halodesulfovibrio sp.]MCT4535512.1 hypothetical protein [Halodesulfovibrio sp.]MCT4626326.1 hypothetical protein [Halodesulfovibrio sp.]